MSHPTAQLISLKLEVLGGSPQLMINPLSVTVTEGERKKMREEKD